MTGQPVRRVSSGVALSHWILVLGGLVAMQGANAFVTIVLARNVGLLEYGQYIAVFSLVSLLAVLPLFGMDSWLLATGAHRPTQINDLLFSALRIRVALFIAWWVAVTVLSLFLPAATFPPTLVAITAAGMACDGVSTLSFAAWRVLGHHRWVSVAQLAASLTLIGATWLVIRASGNVAQFALTRTLISAVLAAAVLRHALVTMRRTTQPVASAQIIHESRTFMLAELSVAVYVRADIAIVGLILGRIAVSVYAPASTLINAWFMVPTALYLVVLPLLSQAYRTSASEFARLWKTHLYWQVLVGVVATVAIFLLAAPLIALIYGRDYTASAEILRILSPIAAIKGCSFGLGALLTASGQQARRTWAQLVTAGFNVAANLVVVGIWGVAGVATVYVISEIILSTGYALVARLKPAPPVKIT